MESPEKLGFIVWNVRQGSEQEAIKNTLEKLIRQIGTENIILILVLQECSQKKAEFIKNNLPDFQLADTSSNSLIKVIYRLSSDFLIQEILNMNELASNENFIKLCNGHRLLMLGANHHISKTIKDIPQVKEIVEDNLECPIIFDKSIFEKILFIKLNYAGKPVMLIGGVHFWSKVSNSFAENNQALITNILIIQHFYSSEFDSRMLLTGDFNMNPYEELLYNNKFIDEIAIPSYLHTLNDKLLVKQDKYKNAFYNPCWNLLGDKNLPNYSYNKTDDKYEKVRNLFDQVIMRQGLTEAFDSDSLKIVDTGNVSDHFPLIFVFDTSKILTSL